MSPSGSLVGTSQLQPSYISFIEKATDLREWPYQKADFTLPFCHFPCKTVRLKGKKQILLFFYYHATPWSKQAQFPGQKPRKDRWSDSGVSDLRLKIMKSITALLLAVILFCYSWCFFAIKVLWGGTLYGSGIKLLTALKLPIYFYRNSI